MDEGGNARPNEVIYTWESDRRLLAAIDTIEIREGEYFVAGEGVIDTADAVANDDGSRLNILEKMQFSLIDADGNPLKFPVRLVSATQFVEDPLPNDADPLLDLAWDQARARAEQRDDH